MKIVGVLSWADESCSWLATAVSGFARFCDEIVAVDGFYALYPGARNRSRPDQAEAIMLACEAAEVGCTIHRPRTVFAGNEVEKRQLTLRLAGTTNPDWIIVFDADNHVYQARPDIIRQQLEITDRNVATFTILDGRDLLADPGSAEYARDHDASTEWTYRARQIYRWTPDLAYGPAHYTVSGTYGGRTQWLRGPDMVAGSDPGSVPPACHLLDNLVVHHRTSHRAKVRRDAAAGYYRMRDEYQPESLDGWCPKSVMVEA